MTQPKDNTALTVQDTQLPVLPTYEDPTLVLDRSTQWATALMKVVEDKGMYAAIGEKKYLEVEAWQLVAMFAQAHSIPREPTPEFDGEGNIIGYQCTADVFQHGVLIGGGTSSCGFDANATKDRTGSDQHKAAKSAAQTFAVSKSLRNTYAFVAKLAGYEGTTAEEMTSSGVLTTNPMMFCPVHQLEWFKRGAMKQSAHPIEGEKGPRGGTKWCNQEDVMDNFSFRMKAITRVQKWGEQEIKERGEAWAKMTPAEKLGTIDQYEAVPIDGPQSNEQSDVCPHDWDKENGVCTMCGEKLESEETVATDG